MCDSFGWFAHSRICCINRKITTWQLWGTCRMVVMMMLNHNCWLFWSTVKVACSWDPWVTRRRFLFKLLDGATCSIRGTRELRTRRRPLWTSILKNFPMRWVTLLLNLNRRMSIRKTSFGGAMRLAVWRLPLNCNWQIRVIILFLNALILQILAARRVIRGLLLVNSDWVWEMTCREVADALLSDHRFWDCSLTLLIDSLCTSLVMRWLVRCVDGGSWALMLTFSLAPVTFGRMSLRKDLLGTRDLRLIMVRALLSDSMGLLWTVPVDCRRWLLNYCATCSNLILDG